MTLDGTEFFIDAIKKKNKQPRDYLTDISYNGYAEI